jgi:hypothetical protein
LKNQFVLDQAPLIACSSVKASCRFFEHASTKRDHKRMTNTQTTDLGSTQFVQFIGTDIA